MNNLKHNNAGFLLRVFLFSVLILSSILSSSIANDAKTKDQDIITSPRGTINVSDPIILENIKLIHILEKETLAESIDKLSEIDQYMKGGEFLYFSQGIYTHIPLEPSVGQIDLATIMGNRRFLKVMQDLSKLPEKDASLIVSENLQTTLKEYEDSFNSYMKFHEKALKDNVKKYRLRSPLNIIGFSERIPSEKPSLRGLRYKILSLVLIAGNLDLRLNKNNINEITKIALDQKKLFYDPNAFCAPDATTMLTLASLYNRQILSIGMIGTDENKKEILEKLQKEKDNSLKVKKLVPYNALVTPLEAKRLFSPVDDSKGTMDVQCFDKMSDQAFENIVNNLVLNPKTQ